MSLATREIYSPNYYRQGWIYGPPKVVFIHASRSGIEGRTHEKELASTINWFSTSGSQASAQWIISPVERVRMVPDEYPSWCTGYHNFEGFNIELTQPTARTPYQPGHYRNLAIVCAPYVQQGIPIARVSYWAYAQDQPRGFVGHENTQQGQSVGKSDPGPMFNWDEFLSILRYELEEETDMPWYVECQDGPHKGERFTIGDFRNEIPVGSGRWDSCARANGGQGPAKVSWAFLAQYQPASEMPTVTRLKKALKI